MHPCGKSRQPNVFDIKPLLLLLSLVWANTPRPPMNCDQSRRPSQIREPNDKHSQSRSGPRL